MSDLNQLPGTESPNGASSPLAGVEVKLARRRLLKLGAGGVGVAATLASRPVLAWDCVTASAWGSAQLNPTASVTARTNSHSVIDETWTLANWKADTTTGSNMATKPWTYLGSSAIRTSGNLAPTKSNFKVSDLFAGTTIPPGLTGTDLVWDNLTTTKPVSNFLQYMLAARLNFRLVPAVQQCLVTVNGDQLKDMADGNYTPPNVSGGTAWNSTDIIRYLNNNSIVKAN